MTRKTLNLAIAAALLGSLALVGCKKKQDEAAMTPPAAETPAPAPAPAETPAPASTVTVTSVDLGNAVGTDKKVTTSMTTFAPKDTIYAAVSTSSTDPATPATGKLGAKWTYQDGQVVDDSSQDFNFTGTDTTDFSINKPSGFPTGSYKVEISLDGNVVQSKDFEVK